MLLVVKAVMQRKRVSEDGSLTPEDARLLIAAYDAAQPDPAFLAVQETQRQALRALLIDDERVLDLERNWTRYTREQPEVFQATIIHMAGLVSQAFGIAEPPRVVFEELDGPEATYEPATNTITIVPDIALQGAGSLTYLTVIEEVYHAYQQQEAEALLAGRPQDPAVTRRGALWLLNGELYFNDRALGAMGIKDSYKGQPMEVDGASLKQPMTVILDEIRNKAG